MDPFLINKICTTIHQHANFFFCKKIDSREVPSNLIAKEGQLCHRKAGRCDDQLPVLSRQTKKALGQRAGRKIKTKKKRENEKCGVASVVRPISREVLSYKLVGERTKLNEPPKRIRGVRCNSDAKARDAGRGCLSRTSMLSDDPDW